MSVVTRAVVAVVLLSILTGCGGTSLGSAPGLDVGTPLQATLRVSVTVPQTLGKTASAQASNTLTVHVADPDTEEDMVPPVTVWGAPGTHLVEVPDVPAAPLIEVRCTVNDNDGSEVGWAETRTEIDRADPRVSLTTGPPALNAAGAWTSFGPAPVYDRFNIVNANSTGRIGAMLVDPADPRRIFAGTACGGVWYSADGGAAWTCLTPSMESNAIGDMIFDPADATRQTILVGTGEPVSSGVYGAGIFRVTLNPPSVTRVEGSETFAGKAISKIIIRPDGTMYVGVYALSTFGVITDGDFGLFVRRPGQTAFTNAFVASLGQDGKTRLPVVDLVARNGVNVGDPDILVAAVDAYAVLRDQNTSGLYRSLDGGATWAALSIADAHGTTLVDETKLGRISIALAPSNPDVLYALVGKQDRSFVSAFVSANRGNAWVEVKTTPDVRTLASYISRTSGLVGQSSYNNTVTIDPRDPHTFYGAGTRPFRVSAVDFTTGAATGHSLASGDGGFQQDSQHPHVDHHFMMAMVSPANGTTTLYDGCDGGAWLLTNAASAVSATAWTNLNGSTSFLDTAQIYGLSLDPGDNTTLFCGTQDNGSSGTLNNRCWSAVRGGDGGITRFDGARRVAYITTQYSSGSRYRLSRVTVVNGGFKSQVSDGAGLIVGDSGLFIPPLALFAGDGRLALGTVRVYESTNGGDVWTESSQDLRNGNVTAIAYHPSNAAIMWVGMSNGGVFRTTDAERATAFENVYRSNLPAGQALSAIAVDPSDDSGGTAYLGLGSFNRQVAGKLPGQVFRTVDGGQTYTDFSDGLPRVPVLALALSTAVEPNLLFAGTDRGVFVRALDGTSAWTTFGSGLPVVPVRSLDFGRKKRNGTTFLAAGTFGRGAWQIPVTVEARAVAPVDQPAADAEVATDDTEEKDGTGFDEPLAPPDDW